MTEIMQAGEEADLSYGLHTSDIVVDMTKFSIPLEPESNPEIQNDSVFFHPHPLGLLVQPQHNPSFRVRG